MEGRATPSGWYTDPQGRFEYRYFNGVQWTSDVAVDGRRYVDTVGPSPTPPGQPTRPPRGMAIAAFVTGTAGIVTGWVPFVFVLAACSAVLAVIFGVIGLRTARRNDGYGRGFAVAGLVLAPIALTVCVAGFLLTRAVLHEIRDFIEPGSHEVVIDTCAVDGGTATVHGTIRNTDTLPHVYRIVVHVDSGADTATATVPVPEVAAGATAPWTATTDIDGASITCAVSDVFGPLPFGVDEQS